MTQLISILKTLSFTIMLIWMLPSCGTMRYTPGETPEMTEENRRLAIQQTLASDYSNINVKYTPLTYGTLKVVKPDSYIKLDSLFEKKYANRYSSDRDMMEDLDNEISRQQGIINNDTNPILYVETHWYKLENNGELEFTTSEITLRKDNKIRNMRTIESFNASPEDAVFAEAFAKEESIFTSGALYSEEANFYKLYKSHAFQLQGTVKDKFMKHTFALMRIAQKNRSYSTEKLLQALAKEQYLKDFSSRADHALDIKANEVIDNADEKQQFLYYEVIITDLTDPQATPAAYRFDQFLMAL